MQNIATMNNQIRSEENQYPDKTNSESSDPNSRQNSNTNSDTDSKTNSDTGSGSLSNSNSLSGNTINDQQSSGQVSPNGIIEGTSMGTTGSSLQMVKNISGFPIIDIRPLLDKELVFNSRSKMSKKLWSSPGPDSQILDIKKIKKWQSSKYFKTLESLNIYFDIPQPQADFTGFALSLQNSIWHLAVTEGNRDEKIGGPMKNTAEDTVFQRMGECTVHLDPEVEELLDPCNPWAGFDREEIL